MNRHFADKVATTGNSGTTKGNDSRKDTESVNSGKGKGKETQNCEAKATADDSSSTPHRNHTPEQIEPQIQDQSSSQKDSNSGSSSDSGSESGSQIKPPPRPRFVPRSKRTTFHQVATKFTSNINWNATETVKTETYQVDDTDGVNVQQEYEDWLERDASRKARDTAQLEELEQEYEERMERMELAAKRARERI